MVSEYLSAGWTVLIGILGAARVFEYLDRRVTLVCLTVQLLLFLSFEGRWPVSRWVGRDGVPEIVQLFEVKCFAQTK